ncbi:reverse transcriptase domain-containing protein [Tanacetum coccineum]|uniref:Reverse transcriptase domain-containing protein n=1 Tax=Tanacetum coccineum TaxID=301880 RepID=A0ABQ5A195_9ASTR
MSVRLPDKSFQYLVRIAKNMLVKVGKFTFPTDFVILEIEEDSKVSPILRRPFLHTADVVIRVKQKQLNLGVGDGSELIFNIDSSIKHSYSNDDTCFSIDEILEEDFDDLLDEGRKILHSIEGTILEKEIFSEFDKFIAMAENENYDSESDEEEPKFEKITINTDYKIKTSLEEPPTDLELKPLPDNLEYVFLEEPSFLPVIISSQLSAQNKSKLVSVLKKHKEAFAWKTTDIPGICPSFCKHKIQLLDDKKPVVQKQRRLNPNMQEVVKKEIVKLLDTGIIYPIADSPWVSPIHCVPKKGGITVVTNENDELVPTRTVTGWRIMTPKKRTTRASPATTTTTTPVTNVRLKALIDQGVANALAARDAKRSRNGDDSRQNELLELALLCERMFPEESDKIEKYVGGLSDMIHGSVMASKPKTMQDAIEIATELMDKKINTLAERQAKNKRKLDNNNQAQQQPPKKKGVAITYTTGFGERKEYVGTLPLCNKCKFHHNGQCTVKCANCKRVGHLTRDCRSPAATNNQRNPTCYECGYQGYYRSDCPKLKNQNIETKLEESSDDDSSTSDSEDEEYAMACGDPNHLVGECPKLSRYQNQKAFVGGPWSDSDKDEEEKTNDEKCLMAKAPMMVFRKPNYFSDDQSSLDENDLDKLSPDTKQWEELIRENVFGLGGHQDRLPACLAHMFYCVVAEEQYNLANFFVKRIECARATPTANLPYGMFLTRLYRHVMETYPHLDNGIYDIVERHCVFCALKQTSTSSK